MQKHFSFAEYYDSERMHWGNLRAWNDDTSIRTMLAQHGTVILPSGYSDPALVDISQAGGGTPYGAWTIAAADGSGQPGARELGIARHLGEYVAKITAKLKD